MQHAVKEGNRTLGGRHIQGKIMLSWLVSIHQKVQTHDVISIY